MTNRRDFIVKTGYLLAGTPLLNSCSKPDRNINNIGVQLYTFREAMTNDPKGTLKEVAELGFKQIESARSSKGHYYGLTAREIRNVCEDLGLTIRSGHVHLDDNWQATVNEAADSGQEYLICSSMPTKEQTTDNYKRVAEQFNKAGEECQKLGIKFGYHNHAYEFESADGQVLYDVLLDNTNPKLVHMELDLGWVTVGGKNPLDYFKKYPGRFPLWHLKDMDLQEKQSTEFGKGGLDIAAMLDNRGTSGVQHIFVEQEEYASSPMESMRFNLEYLKNL